MADINLGVGGANSAVGGYDIANSLKFEIDNSEYLGKTFSSAGNRKAWTWSSWVKRTELNSSTTYQLLFSAGTGNPPRDVFFFDDDTDDTLCFFSNGGLLSSPTLGFRTNAVFRDTSAWYHIVLVLDTANSTAADRLKLYVNGVSQTFSTYNAPTQNADSLINSNTDHAIGRDSSFAALGFDAQYFSGYMAETHFVDGTALAPTDFGEFDEDSGIWKPKAYTGSYGSNGFYLDYADALDLGDDESGNGNDWTEVNITAADQAQDTPTNNFAIYNQLIPKDEFIIYQGGTRTQKTTATRWRTAASTLAVANGKWYAEFQNSLYSATGTNRIVGVAPASIFTESSSSTGGYLGGNSTETTDSIGFYSINGRYYINGNSFVWGNTWTADEIIGVALDMDNGYVYFSINGTWQNSGDPTSGSSGTGGIALQLSDEAHYIAGSIYNSNAQLEVNYGGFTVMSIASGNADANGYGNFEYVPPSGYYALCTKNLAEFG